jgi:hypothetical protein
MNDMADAETELHLIIKGLRNSADGRMMVCSSADRAQIVKAILDAGFGPVREAQSEAWDEGVGAGRKYPADAKARNPYRAATDQP